jgi:PII-like signaling protein
MTLRRGAAMRLTVYLHADAHWHHHSVSDEIIHRAHDDGLAGASRFEGFLGYGKLGILHNDIDPDIAGDLPCMVEIVDPSEERLRAFLPRIAEVLNHGLVVLEPTEIVSVFSEAASESAAEGTRA